MKGEAYLTVFETKGFLMLQKIICEQKNIQIFARHFLTDGNAKFSNSTNVDINHSPWYLLQSPSKRLEMTHSVTNSPKGRMCKSFGLFSWWEH